MAESITQPNLIVLENQDTDASLELFPATWQAAEKLLCSDVKTRHQGLDELLSSQAARVSPLIAYLVVTRLFDPDKEMRLRVVEALANILRRDENGQYAPEAVRAQIISGLSHLGDQGLYSLLEAGIEHGEMREHIAKLINFAPHTGRFLKELAGDRSKQIEMRRLAIHFLGRIGYVDAYSELLRIRNRIESRQLGQKRMPFAPPSAESEELLLPDLRKVLIALGS
ncbi:MAG: hypothetical protein JW757_09030 [Anaerolineales bacterium]|nr:hypothetical protein [Anaerolineales bacterium]